MTTLKGMTKQIWDNMPEGERERLRDLSGLTKQLIGCEGWRVEAITFYGEMRRFIVGRSTGWKPCHIELLRRDSTGGAGAHMQYRSVRRLYRVR